MQLETLKGNGDICSWCKHAKRISGANISPNELHLCEPQTLANHNVVKLGQQCTSLEENVECTPSYQEQLHSPMQESVLVKLSSKHSVAARNTQCRP